MLLAVETFDQLHKELLAVLSPFSVVAALVGVVAGTADLRVKFDFDSSQILEESDVVDNLLELIRYFSILAIVLVVEVAGCIGRTLGVIVFTAIVPLRSGLGAAMVAGQPECEKIAVDESARSGSRLRGN